MTEFGRQCNGTTLASRYISLRGTAFPRISRTRPHSRRHGVNPWPTGPRPTAIRRRSSTLIRRSLIRHYGLYLLSYPFTERTLTCSYSGDWAGGVWDSAGFPGQEQSCSQRTGFSTCDAFVLASGASFAEACKYSLSSLIQCACSRISWL